MKILVTNDDGIYAEGIQQLVKAIERDDRHEVVVVAPDRERSATGHAITLHRPLRVKEMNYSDINARSLAVDGTPADCVKIAIESILEEKPDVVISGINRGPNLGCDVLYSGTVAAAFEGLLFGVPAIAVSLASYEDCDFVYGAEFIREFIADLELKELDPEVLFNINLPACGKDNLAGVKFTNLGNRSYINTLDERTDPRGDTYYWLAGDVVEDDNDQQADVVAVKQNQISITPVKLNLTDFDLVEELNGKDLNLFNES
ncbi:MAG: 5'/3'-nucleotidase SurE [Bacillota bacterium]